MTERLPVVGTASAIVKPKLGRCHVSAYEKYRRSVLYAAGFRRMLLRYLTHSMAGICRKKVNDNDGKNHQQVKSNAKIDVAMRNCDPRRASRVNFCQNYRAELRRSNSKSSSIIGENKFSIMRIISEKHLHGKIYSAACSISSV